MAPRDMHPGLTDAIIRRYEEEGPSKLAQEFGCPIDVVRARANYRGLKSLNRGKHGSETKKKNRSDLWHSLANAIRSRYPIEGAHPIAADFGVKPQRVYTIAYRLGIKSTNHRANLVESFIANTKNCNAAAFDAPISNEAAYFLGLLWADGCIEWCPSTSTHKVRLDLTEPEWHLLEAYKSFLCVEGHIRNVRTKEGNMRQQSVYLGNKRLVRRLVEIGIEQNKSNRYLGHPAGIPDEVFNHWARGWLDGDGSLYYGKKKPLRTPRIVWYGSKPAVEHIGEKISELVGVPRKPVYQSRKNCECYGVRWAAWKDVRKLLLWLHRDVGTYCHRKHDRPLLQLRTLPANRRS